MVGILIVFMLLNFTLSLSFWGLILPSGTKPKSVFRMMRLVGQIHYDLSAERYRGSAPPLFPAPLGVYVPDTRSLSSRYDQSNARSMWFHIFSHIFIFIAGLTGDCSWLLYLRNGIRSRESGVQN